MLPEEPFQIFLHANAPPQNLHTCEQRETVALQTTCRNLFGMSGMALCIIGLTVKTERSIPCLSTQKFWRIHGAFSIHDRPSVWADYREKGYFNMMCFSYRIQMSVMPLLFDAKVFIKIKRERYLDRIGASRQQCNECHFNLSTERSDCFLLYVCTCVRVCVCVCMWRQERISKCCDCCAVQH